MPVALVEHSEAQLHEGDRVRGEVLNPGQEWGDQLDAWNADKKDAIVPCLATAPGESFRGRLKAASVHGRKFAARAQAAMAVMDWMSFHNCTRLHSSLGHVRPMKFEQRWFTAQRKKSA